MPPPTSSLKPAAGASGKKSPVNGSKGDATPVDAEKKVAGAAGSSKPDQSKYNAEQDGYNKEIAEIKTKLVSGVWAPCGICVFLSCHVVKSA
jgi:hypothetical protein